MEQRTICPDCKREIDESVCWCGDPMDGHSVYSGHTGVPMGCCCHHAGESWATETIEPKKKAAEATRG